MTTCEALSTCESLKLTHYPKDGDQAQGEQHWKTVFLILDGCIRPEKREEVAGELKMHQEDQWLEAGILVFSKGVGNTVTLGIGWLVYTFLVSN